ncbi:7-carboxy-7-deazaguanine synthase [Hydrogenophaga intermedia]|uniref:7-carboxy-7-deazaguanine synthase n=1 Tax=Hydrogenophaga intermedia TaxID=65786 RepID=UPI002042E0EF|nr:7-carboxy-7-deazaguanine synthase [Hydrogenophaga intermedia]MCM3564749.1 7-carboxy-7-deazaguanine synthase [Hydrogenophaga intermedia]
MSYMVKEVFYTIQGEGGNVGRAAVFCRFAGCNLWSGREADRASAQCQFCDTDFVGVDGTGGGKFDSAQALADQVSAHWPALVAGQKLVVLTGGEPLLQVDSALIEALHCSGFEIAVETNGTIVAPAGVDWLCVSPKARTSLKIRAGHELKVVVPQFGMDLDALIELNFERHLLQPMDGPELEKNTLWAIEYCLRDPRWRLTLQTHKMVGIR